MQLASAASRPTEKQQVLFIAFASQNLERERARGC